MLRLDKRIKIRYSELIKQANDMGRPKAVKDRPLTRKEAEFVKERLDNPKGSGTEAALKAYSTPEKQISRQAAAQLAYENMRKPAIVSKLQDYTQLVESALVGTVEDWSKEDAPRKREIALDAAKFIHDKVHGRATQKVEMQSQQVVITIDMTKPAPTEQ